MFHYKTTCANCKRPLEVSSSTLAIESHLDYCNANCEQSAFDKGNDPQLWSKRRIKAEADKKEQTNV